MSYQFEAVGSDGRAELYADSQDREARPRFRGLVASLIALVVVALFGGGLWFAYQQGFRHGGALSGAADVPLIRADERPTKVKPEKAGRHGSSGSRQADLHAKARGGGASPAATREADAAARGACRRHKSRRTTTAPRSSGLRCCGSPLAGPTPAGYGQGDPRPPQRRSEPGSSSVRCAARRRRARNGTASSAQIQICSRAFRRHPFVPILGTRACFIDCRPLRSRMGTGSAAS